MGKSISQYSEQIAPAGSDKILFQRGNDYYYFQHENLMLGIQRKVLTLTQAQLQAISGTPISLVDAPGAGKVIEPLACAVFLDHNGTTYATLTTLRLKHSGNSNLMMSTSSSFGTAAADRYEKMVVSAASATNQEMFANTALVIDGNANATNNGGTVTVDLLYVIKKFS
jgi:hypothetical protein